MLLGIIPLTDLLLESVQIYIIFAQRTKCSQFRWLMLHNIFREIVLNIYTDGYKKHDGDTEAKFVVHGLKIIMSSMLPAQLSVFTCEIAAIHMSLYMY